MFDNSKRSPVFGRGSKFKRYGIIMSVATALTLLAFLLFAMIAAFFDRKITGRLSYSDRVKLRVMHPIDARSVGKQIIAAETAAPPPSPGAKTTTQTTAPDAIPSDVSQASAPDPKQSVSADTGSGVGDALR